MGRSTATVRTLVVTDLVDSTRLFATLGDRPAARLSARHERLARDLVWECGGREIDKTDGFLLLFDRAVDAVRFALSYHRSLASLSEEEGIELAARVGIHLGEVYERRNPPEDVERGAKPVEIEGVAKPVAARVMALASARQTLLTRAAFDLARQGVASEPLAVEGTLRWLAHGPYRLKGVEEPVEIYEVGVSGFAPLVVPKSTAKARRAVSADDELTLGWRPAPGLEIPRRDGWFVSEKLGEGGFGEVWLGRNSKTGEPRVFKFCYRADRLRSLQREVTIFRLLKETLGARADIARILDWNFDHAPYFLESEYTEGGNLLEWVAEQGGADRVPRSVRLGLLAQVADALAAAHSVGVLHKDVKPSNVLITTGRDGQPRVRLTDFGIGVLTDRGVLADRGITLFDLTEMVADSPGSAGGTHLYMAPELVEGRTPTVQADLYALGVMLYQFLVGDFSRTLAPGWRRDIDDELLREDLASLVDGHPERRLRSAQEAAERLRTVDERRARAEAERRDREQREDERRALERAHRRRRVSALVAAGAVLVLAVVSLLAYQAIEARKEAERRRAQAESLIGFMVGDLRDKLEPIGKLEILDEVGDQAMAYFEAVPSDELTDDELFRRAQALYQIGEVRSRQGNLSSALDSYQESLELARRLVDRNPDNGAWWKALGASHFGVGYVFWRQRRMEKAERAFREYLTIAETQAARRPDDPEWTLELAYALSNIGSVLQDRGDLEDARQSFARSLALRERLVTQHPERADLVRGLAIAHNKLGVVLDSLGDPKAALEHFHEDLRLTDGLIAQHPGDAGLRHRKAVCHSYIGFVLEALGDLDDAMAHYLEGYRILIDINPGNPTNSSWKRDLAVLERQRASALLATGRTVEAESLLHDSEATLETLVEHNSTDAGWRHDLAHVRVTAARVLARTGRRTEAEQKLRRSLTLLNTLRADQPTDQDLAVLSSEANTLLGEIQQASGRGEEAARSWSRAADLVAPFMHGSRDHEILAAWARPMLLLGRRKQAAPAVGTLLEIGYRNKEFLRLCVERGIAVDSSPDETADLSPQEATGSG